MRHHPSYLSFHEKRYGYPGAPLENYPPQMYHSYQKPTAESLIKNPGTKSTFGERETKPDTTIQQSKTSLKAGTEPGSSIGVFKKDINEAQTPVVDQDKAGTEKAASTRQTEPVVQNAPKAGEEGAPSNNAGD